MLKSSQHNHHSHEHSGKASASGVNVQLELEIQNYFMGSACPNIEHHVMATDGVYQVNLNRTNGIIHVDYDPMQTTPEAVIEAVKHCGFICQEGGPVHTVSYDHPSSAEHEEHGDEHAGHGTHMATTMRNLFVFAAILTVIEIIYSSLGTRMLNLDLTTPFGISNEIFQLLLTTPVVFLGGRPFLSVAWTALLRRQINMATLISTGILAAYLYSVGATFLFEGEVFYEAAAMLTTFSLLGHWMEMAARNATGEALSSLLKLVPDTARIIRDGEEIEVPVDEVKIGDMVAVRPGE